MMRSALLVVALAACTGSHLAPGPTPTPTYTPRMVDPHANSACFPGATAQECPGPWNEP